MSHIIKQFTKILFPFSYNPLDIKIKEAFYENSKGKKFPVFLPFSLTGEYLRDGLNLLLNENGQTAKIANCYALNINCRSYFCLPSQKAGTISFMTRMAPEAPYSISLQELRIYLFESGVGFLELEFCYQTASLQDYSNISYFLCETKSRQNYFSSSRKTGKDDNGNFITQTNTFTLSDFITRINQCICDGKEGLQFYYKSEKPLLYSYLLTDTKPDNHEDLLYHLNKNYKDSYKFDTTCLGINTIHPFENYYWTASLSGVTNLSYQTDDKTTNHFFEDNFYEKALTTYYYLFLNVIHQRYSISRIMAEMAQLNCFVYDYSIMNKQLTEAQKCEEKAINLKFRAFFQNPSSVDHINAYYQMLTKAFETEVLFDAFSKDIVNLQSICDRYMQRIQNRNEKIKQLKQSKTEIFVLIFGVLVAELTIFNGSWDLIEKMLGKTVSLCSPAIILLVISLLSPLVTVVKNIKKQISKIKALKKDLSSENAYDFITDDKL